MVTARKYSLWLRPQGDIAFSLQQRIQKLSKKYESASFEPHITLVGGLSAGETELKQLTDTLAGALSPFDIILTHADIGNTYYQSLFVRIKETKELMNARKKAKQMLSISRNDKEDYFPHLSLMYGDFKREQKERILNTMGREFHLRFSVSNLLLIETSGKPQEWEKIYTAEFSQAQ